MNLAPMAVVAALLFDEEGRVLLASRPAGKSFAGRWEFPGGKCEPGERPADALVRELAEELGLTVSTADCASWLSVQHCYPGAGRAVRIEAFRVRAFRGTVHPREGQQLQWVRAEQLTAIDILEADRPIVTALQLGESVVLDRLGPLFAVCTLPALDVPQPDRPVRTGVHLEPPLAVAEAVRRGADFLLLGAEPSPTERAALQACGLPWYVPAGVNTPGAHGVWSDHSRVATSIST